MSNLYKTAEGSSFSKVLTFLGMLMFGVIFMSIITLVNGYEMSGEDIAFFLLFSFGTALLLSLAIYKNFLFSLLFIVVTYFFVFLPAILLIEGIFPLQSGISGEGMGYIVFGGLFTLAIGLIIYFLGFLIFRPIFNLLFGKNQTVSIK